MKQINNMTQFSRELDRLLEIESRWMKIPFNEISKELGMPIGMSVGENLLRYIKKLKEGEKE